MYEVLLLILSLLLGIVPLYLLHRFDLHDPEPFPILIGSALVGGFVSGGLAFLAFSALASAGVVIVPASLHSFTIIAPVEELARLAGCIAVYRLYAEYFDEPVDYAVYMGAVAIGFAALENAVYATSSPDAGWLLGVRLLVTTPVHVIFAIFLGLGVAHAARRPGIHGIRVFFAWPVLQGLGLAILFHGLWDFAAFRAWPYLALHVLFVLLFVRGRFVLSYLLASSHLRPRFEDDLTRAESVSTTSESPTSRSLDFLAPAGGETGQACPVCGAARSGSVRRLVPGSVYVCDHCGHASTDRSTLEGLFHYYGSLMSGLFLRWRRSVDAPMNFCDGEARTLIAANYYCRRRRVASFVPAELGRVFEEINQTTDDRYHRLWLRV